MEMQIISYFRNHEHEREFQKIFSSLIFLTVYLPVSKISTRTGFLLGIFFRGAKSIVMQISFVMLLFSDQISGRGKRF